MPVNNLLLPLAAAMLPKARKSLRLSCIEDSTPPKAGFMRRMNVGDIN